MDTNPDTIAPSTWRDRLGDKFQTQRANKKVAQLVGKHAPTEDELAAQARDYIRHRLRNAGGFWGEGLPGFWHKTLPILLGRESRLTVWGVLSLAIQFVTVLGAAVLPILGRRALLNPQQASAASGIAAVGQLVASLTPLDYWLAVAGLLFVGLPKLVREWQKRRKPTAHSPYPDLAAAIDRMPALDNGAQDHARGEALTRLLAALKLEMAELIADPQRRRLVDVTLLQYCGENGDCMQVTARTAVGEPTHRPRASGLFQANYVGRQGRWFAENDFLSKRNPFKPERLTVLGGHKVGYRSVLYLPICTSERPGGVGREVRDFCIGVICVQSDRAYRFWRWGDHKKDNGAGFGNVAIERALPYIALVTKLIENTAQKVPVEVA